MGEEALREEVAPDQLPEQSPTAPAEGIWNRVPIALESLVLFIIVAPMIGIGHMNAQTWTQNSKRSFIRILEQKTKMKTRRQTSLRYFCSSRCFKEAITRTY